MIKLKSNKVLYWIIAFLFMTNVATIGSIFYHQRKMQKIDELMVKKYRFQNEQKYETKIDKTFQKELSLSDAQAEKFREYRGDFSKNIKSLFYEMHLERKNFIEALGQESVNEDEVKQIADRIGQLHRQMKMETMDLYLQMNNECTPEQRIRLIKIFERFIRRSDFDDRARKRKFRKRHRHGWNGKHKLEQQNK